MRTDARCLAAIVFTSISSAHAADTVTWGKLVQNAARLTVLELTVDAAEATKQTGPAPRSFVDLNAKPTATPGYAPMNSVPVGAAMPGTPPPPQAPPAGQAPASTSSPDGAAPMTTPSRPTQVGTVVRNGDLSIEAWSRSPTGGKP